MSGKEYSYLKAMSELLISEIIPVGREIVNFLEDKAQLERILKKAEKANIIVEENLKNVREKVIDII